MSFQDVVLGPRQDAPSPTSTLQEPTSTSNNPSMPHHSLKLSVSTKGSTTAMTRKEARAYTKSSVHGIDDHSSTASSPSVAMTSCSSSSSSSGIVDTNHSHDCLSRSENHATNTETSEATQAPRGRRRLPLTEPREVSRSSGRGRSTGKPVSTFASLTLETEKFHNLISSLEEQLRRSGESPELAWQAKIMSDSAQEIDQDLWEKIHAYERTLVVEPQKQLRASSLKRSNRRGRGKNAPQVHMTNTISAWEVEAITRKAQTACSKLRRDFQRAHKQLNAVLSMHEKRQGADVAMLRSSKLGWNRTSGSKNSTNSPSSSSVAPSESDFFDRSMRERELKQIHSSMHHIKQVYGDLASLVQGQQAQVDSIEDKAAESKGYVVAAVDESACAMHRDQLCGALQSIGGSFQSAGQLGCGTPAMCAGGYGILSGDHEESEQSKELRSAAFFARQRGQLFDSLRITGDTGCNTSTLFTRDDGVVQRGQCKTEGIKSASAWSCGPDLSFEVFRGCASGTVIVTSDRVLNDESQHEIELQLVEREERVFPLGDEEFEYLLAWLELHAHDVYELIVDRSKQAATAEGSAGRNHLSTTNALPQPGKLQHTPRSGESSVMTGESVPPPPPPPPPFARDKYHVASYTSTLETIREDVGAREPDVMALQGTMVAMPDPNQLSHTPRSGESSIMTGVSLPPPPPPPLPRNKSHDPGCTTTLATIREDVLALGQDVAALQRTVVSIMGHQLVFMRANPAVCGAEDEFPEYN
jgi:hypothetical protein